MPLSNSMALALQKTCSVSTSMDVISLIFRGVSDRDTKVAILSPTWASVEPARSAPISLMRPIRIPPDFVTGSWNFPRSSTIFWISWAIRFTSPPHSCLMRPKAVAVGWSAMTSIRISLEQIVGELSTRSAACGSNPLGEMTRWLPYGSPRMVESPFCSEILYF